MKNINYPTAYGHLWARVGLLAHKFELECRMKGMECSDEQVELLREMVEEMRSKAYDHAVAGEKDFIDTI